MHPTDCAGLYFGKTGRVTVPRVQIVTIEDAMRLRDRAVRLPLRRTDTFRQAAREDRGGRQASMDL